MKEKDEHARTLTDWPSPWTTNTEPPIATLLRAVGDTSSRRPKASHVDHSSGAILSRIAITSRRKIVFVDLADVAAVEARCNYVVLRTLSGAHALRQPISTIAENFKQYGFIRIHRSTLVNGCFVEEIRTSPSGKMLVHLKGLGGGYHVSRKYRIALRLFACRLTCGM